MRATPSHLATQLYLRTLPWLFLSNTKNQTTPIGGRAYPVRHYPIAVRLRTRKGYAILCIASFPQSGDSSDAILEVPFKALLHGGIRQCIREVNEIGILIKSIFFQSIAYSWHDFCMCIDD